ncbi:MAG: hypothetical protein KIT18_08435 [Burkholderiales bacterium]|nr:hypothetical protein [Burkholderiales bacterium]
MNLEGPLRAISTALSDADGRSLPVGPGRWQVLFGAKPRPLLIPAMPYRFQERCLDYFIADNHLKSIYAKALLRVHSLIPGAGLLPEFRLPQSGVAAVACGFPFRDPSVAAIQIGSPGPYQKASALLMSECGRPLALVKMAMVRSADHKISVEAGWLKRLAGIADVADRVPRLLAEGTAANGRRYLVSTLAPDTATTDAFTPAHAGFLRALGHACLETMNFRESPCFRSLEQTLAQMESRMTHEQGMSLQAALRDCGTPLCGFSTPFVIAQGDFAPWNIRLHRQRIFVFDWEYAREGANPLADVFNYLLMRRAVSGHVIGVRRLATVMRRAEEIAIQFYPGRKWRPQVISALLLAYLLEVLLGYSRSVRRLELRHPVIACYWDLVRRRREWMAA